MHKLMRRVVVIAVMASALGTFGSAYAGPSNLTDRYGIGLGWVYFHGIGSYSLTASGNDIELNTGSVLDAPKVITTKIGLGQALALEPSLSLAFRNQDGADEAEVFIRLAPVLSYAVFQKEKVNFNFKGGVSLTYAKEVGGHYSDMIFSIPIGFGIEWWLVENLAFDVTVGSHLFSLDTYKTTKNADSKTDVSMAVANMLASFSLVFWF
ncbi:MAG: hypothetical protein HY897_06690 [Deltaproteobacteria bacterium]|nr:hypothetical protein [Deltaproteobacteria bacterium]